MPTNYPSAREVESFRLQCRDLLLSTLMHFEISFLPYVELAPSVSFLPSDPRFCVFLWHDDERRRHEIQVEWIDSMGEAMPISRVSVVLWKWLKNEAEKEIRISDPIRSYFDSPIRDFFPSSPVPSSRKTQREANRSDLMSCFRSEPSD